MVNCASPLRSLVTFDNGDSCVQGTTIGNNISRVRSDTTNGAPFTTSGIDIEVTYRAPEIAGVDVTLGAFFSRTLSYDQQAFVYNGITVAAAYDALGFTNYNRSPGTIPKLRGQAYADLSTGNHNLRVTFNYTGGAADNRGSTVVQTASVTTGCTVANAAATAGCQFVTYGNTVAPFYTFDLSYQLKLPWDMSVTASVYNLFDRDPSRARTEVGYDPGLGNPLGRTFKIGLRKHF